MRSARTTDWEADRDRVSELAAALVAIDSVNPSLGGPDGGEARVAVYIADVCARFGCDVVVEEVLPGRPNVLASLNRGDAYPSLVIEGHMDTVGALPAQLVPNVAGGRLVGRGSCDTKGGIAAALHALERLAASELPLNVRFAGVVDEEVGFRGVSHYVQNHPPADAAVVIEPTSLVPVVAHNGVLRGELRAEGVAVHSSTPELGENAITTLIGELAGLKRWAEGREPNRHELSGRTAFSVTTIRGGTGVNTIPAECVAEFDWRLHPADDPERAREDLDRRLASTRVSLARVSLQDAGLDLDAGHALVQAARTATGSAHVAGLRGGTDASKFARAGVPAIVLGPGSLEQAHTENEWIDLDEAARAAEVYVDLCIAFARA